jgi:hypothetical protein
LTRGAFRLREGGERGVEFGIGSKSEGHASMIPEWYH